MAYRHLLLLGEGNDGGPKLDHIDLGPARVDATIGGRVLEYLRSADRLIETSLAPAALLATRFGLLPEGSDAVEIDTLLGYFYRLPRLPKLASAHVLRQALAEGVRQALFGLASGSTWDAEDSVLRFGGFVDPSEIQFQPGTWLVRAAAIKELITIRKPAEPPGPGETGEPGPGVAVVPENEGPVPRRETAGITERRAPRSATLPGLTLHIRGVPGSKVRDVIKVAVLPLSAASPEVTIDMVIRAEGGMVGIPRETLDLVVLEGLRQLGLSDVEVDTQGDG